MSRSNPLIRRRGSRWERLCDRHPVVVAGCTIALCAAFPFVYEALRGWVN